MTISARRRAPARARARAGCAGRRREHGVGRAVAQRQRAPGVAGDGGRARVGAGGAAQRRLRDVEREPAGGGQVVEHAREVPARPGAEVDHGAGLAEAGAQLRGQGVEVAGGEEALARGDHRCAVAGVGRAAGQQAQVALARDVERVAVPAADRRARARERAAAVGAAQAGEQVVERGHAGIFAA